MAATYTFSIDWSNNGVWTNTGEDVTTRVLAASGVTITYGRDQARALSPTANGSCGFELDNTSRDYSPENGSSPITGLVLPARPIRIQAFLSPTTYTLFRGHLDEFNVLPAKGDRKVQLSGLDPLAKISEAKATTDLYPSIRTGSAIAAILDAIGWSGSARDLDTGATTLRWWSVSGENAWDAIQNILAAEGSPALITADGSGNVVFRDRHHRLVRSASTSSQATFRDTGSEPKFSAPLVYDQGWRDVVNDITFDVDERGPASELTVVWSSDLTYNVAASATLSFIISTNDPFYEMVSPEGPTDYTVVSGSASVNISSTQGQTTTVSITAGGSGAVVNSLQLRAYVVGVQRTLQVSATDATSITTYGSKSGPENAGAAAYEDAQAVASLAVLYRKNRLPIVQLDMKGSNNTRLTQCLTRNLSDRITVVDAETGLNRAFFVEQITHNILEAGLLHVTTFGCEAVPTTSGLDDASTVFIFDHANNGKFGTGKFGT